MYAIVCRNVGTFGMCSKCYREQQAQIERSKPVTEALASAAAAAAAPPQPTVSTPVLEQVASAEPAAASPAPAEAAVSPEPVSKGPSRCQSCRKKVGLTGFKCKCGMMFCGQHRYAEAHGCTFDYKTTERQRLAENNPLVQASKVERI
jgi:hypothetical protein